jgi:DinB superfamily
VARKKGETESVPIPAAPDGASTAAALLALFRQLHQQLREELADLPDAACNWVPTPGANSIGTIVTHTLGSEEETLRCVAGLGWDRDRDAEFVGHPLTRRDVLQLLDRADAVLSELAPRIDEARVRAEISLPTLPAEEIRSGLTWLIGNYGHAREHLGQIQLTKQLSSRWG